MPGGRKTEKWMPVLLFSLQICADRVVPLLDWAPCHEDIWRSGGTALHILNLGAIWSWVVSFMRWPQYPQEKDPRYPLDRRMGKPQSRSGRCGWIREKSYSPVSLLAELFQLQVMCRSKSIFRCNEQKLCTQTQVKVKLSLCLIKHHAMKSTAPCILNFGAGWKWVVSFTPQLLHPYPLDSRLNWSGWWEVALAGNWTQIFGCLAHSLTAVLSELSWIIYIWRWKDGKRRWGIETSGDLL
jgi:hypothetical protein